MLPRVGWEVPVAYIDGNPDRPVVLGRLYNGGAATPYGLPAKKATTALQSASSPADGSTQEIRLTDEAGAMETYIHATRDQSVSVGGTHTITVAVNDSLDVMKSLDVGIGTDQTMTIGASQQVTIGGDGSTSTTGARTESVAALVAYVGSDEAYYVNGAIMAIDCGTTTG